MIISRSMIASLAAIVPVPVLDDRLSYLVQRSMLRRLAREYQVDFDEEAMRSLVFGESAPPSIVNIAGSTLAYKVLSRYLRKVLVTYMTAKRAQIAGRYFVRATLFDHYCAKLHVGMGLQRESALALRGVMSQAVEGTPGSLGTRMFRRGVLAAARASVRAPLELASMVGGGVVQRLLSRGDGDEVIPIEELDLVLEKQLRAQSGFLSRTVTAIELQLSVEGNTYLEELVNNFERIWRIRAEEDVGDPVGSGA